MAIHELTAGDDLPPFKFNIQKPLGTNLALAAADTVHFSFIRRSTSAEIFNVQCTAITGGTTTWKATPPANAFDGLAGGIYLGIIYFLIGGTDRQTSTDQIMFRVKKKLSTT